jgi:hypothetical protein
MPDQGFRSCLAEPLAIHGEPLRGSRRRVFWEHGGRGLLVGTGTHECPGWLDVGLRKGRV